MKSFSRHMVPLFFSFLGGFSKELNPNAMTVNNTQKDLMMDLNLLLGSQELALPELKSLAAHAALTKLLEQSYFSICDLDTVMKLTGSARSCPEYEILRTIHCIEYSKLNPGLRNSIPTLIKKVLANRPADLAGQILNEVKE